MNAPLFRDVARPHDGNTGSLPVGIFGDAIAPCLGGPFLNILATKLIELETP